MRADDFIANFKRENPLVFAADKIKVRPVELERILRMAYNAGHDEGQLAGANGKSVFETIFGGGPRR